MAQQNDHDDRLQVRVEQGLKQGLRVEAAKQGKSMSEFVRGLCRDAVSGPTNEDKVSTTDKSHSEPSGDSGADDASQSSET